MLTCIQQIFLILGNSNRGCRISKIKSWMSVNSWELKLCFFNMCMVVLNNYELVYYTTHTFTSYNIKR